MQALDILACPYDKSRLTLGGTTCVNDELPMTGILVCSSCGRRYPISRGIPRLLPDELRNERLSLLGSDTEDSKAAAIMRK